MPRIRTIKPEFFRHKELQGLSKKHGCEVMLVFIALWTQADKAGNFRWDEDQLSLDILHWVGIDLNKTMEVLGSANYIKKYDHEGKDYGHIPNFLKHQIIFGSERRYNPKYPDYNELKENHSQGSAIVEPRIQELGVMELRNNGNKDISQFREKFDDARKQWPGSKRGLETEWGNFTKKIHDWKEIIPLLFPAVEKAIRFRKECERVKANFIPAYKNFQTWINQRCWEEEFPKEVY